MYWLDEQQDERIETLHIYVYEEEEQKPRWPLSPQSRETLRGVSTLLFLLLGIIALCLCPDTPTYSVKTIAVPAHVLPIQHDSATVTIIPTGTKTDPATQATGRLTMYNGSILNQQLPAGFLLTGRDGIEIVTDQAVIIPAGNAPSYGIATVSAHAASTGAAGNIPAQDIDANYGQAVYIRNPMPFTGGKNEQKRSVATNGDRLAALTHARVALTIQEQKHSGIWVRPCQETLAQKALVLTVSWSCAFVGYPAPAGMQVLSARVQGNSVFLHVKIVVRPHPGIGK